jgi:hypothetical protein
MIVRIGITQTSPTNAPAMMLAKNHLIMNAIMLLNVMFTSATITVLLFVNFGVSMFPFSSLIFGRVPSECFHATVLAESQSASA